MKFIPYSCQDINDDDIEAVVSVLKSDFLTQGPAIDDFEEHLASYCNAYNAIAVSNATAGLYLVYRALGLQPGERLWTVPNSFVATANAAALIGANLDFVDIDPRTMNIDCKKLAAKFSAAMTDGTLPKILTVVHFAGAPCAMKEISDLCKKYGVELVEDAAHALGAHADAQMVGSCSYSRAAIFSFHAVKMITCGEGGAVVTNDNELSEKIRLLATHGVTRDKDRFVNTKYADYGWYYEQQDLSLNFRLTDIQAALAASQLKRLNQFVQTRNHWANKYIKALAEMPVGFQQVLPEATSSYHLFVCLLSSFEERNFVFEYMRERGIGVNLHYMPITMQPYYQSEFSDTSAFPGAFKHVESALSLPLNTKLDDGDFDRVINVFFEGFRAYAG